MAKGSTFCNDLLKLILNGTAIANIADNASAGPLTNLYVSLHTADPSAGNQTTNEATYTSYARVAVARTTGGWTVSGATANPVATISFPQCTGGANTITYFAIGTASSGAGKLLYVGQITTPVGGIAVSTTVIPELTTSTQSTES